MELTRLEFDLLDALSAWPRVVFSRRQLVERVWGQDWVSEDHIVAAPQTRRRRRQPRYVLTARGVGYRMGSGA